MDCPNCFMPLGTSLTSCDRCGWFRRGWRHERLLDALTEARLIREKRERGELSDTEAAVELARLKG